MHNFVVYYPTTAKQKGSYLFKHAIENEPRFFFHFSTCSFVIIYELLASAYDINQ